MIGPIYKNTWGSYCQVIANGVLAGESHELWKEVAVVQILEAPYPIVVIEKDDVRWKNLVEVTESELVKMGAERRAVSRDNG